MLKIMVKVVPSSGRQEWVLDKSGILKCFLKSPPESGAANAELIAFCAKSVGLPRSAVALVSGLTARRKLIMLDTTMTYEQLLVKLGLEVQRAVL